MPPRHACDACYRRKIQCSIPEPGQPCNWCDHHGLACTFDKERPRKSRRTRVTDTYVQELLHRIQQLEAAHGRAPPPPKDTTSCAPPLSLEPVIPAGDGADLDAPQVAVMSRSGRQEDDAAAFTQSASTTPLESSQYQELDTNRAADVFPAKYNLGLNWLFNGIPIFSEQGQQWLQKKTGQIFDWAKYRILNPNPCPNLPLSPAELCELPDKNTTWETLTLYFRSSFLLRFPVLDQELFAETLQMAYDAVDNPLLSPSHISARACVLGALCLFSSLQGPGNLSLGVDPSLLSARARCLILCVAGNNSLHMHYARSQDWQDAELFLSIACRAVSVLGGHVYRPLNRPKVEVGQHERRLGHTRGLFWLCYVFDKDFSLRTGRVPLLSYEHCDLTLPEGYHECYGYLRTLDEFCGGNETAFSQLIPHFPSDLRLCQLKEKVYRTLYSAHALKTTDGVLFYIRHLDDEIERWRLSIPADFRPILSLAPAAPLFTADTTGPHRIHLAHLQFEYHHLITVIHTTVRRYSSAPDSIRSAEEVEGFHNVIHSSVDLALEASRSTLLCLREIILRLPAQAYRFIINYSSTAAMSLFLNIVIHPLNKDAQLDVERLVSAANMIRSLPPEHLMGEDIQRLKDVSDLIMGLVWLGTCAIMQSNTESGGEQASSADP